MIRGKTAGNQADAIKAGKGFGERKGENMNRRVWRNGWSSGSINVIWLVATAMLVALGAIAVHVGACEPGCKVGGETRKVTACSPQYAIFGDIKDVTVGGCNCTDANADKPGAAHFNVCEGQDGIQSTIEMTWRDLHLWWTCTNTNPNASRTFKAAGVPDAEYKSNTITVKGQDFTDIKQVGPGSVVTVSRQNVVQEEWTWDQGRLVTSEDLQSASSYVRDPNGYYVAQTISEGNPVSTTVTRLTMNPEEVITRRRATVKTYNSDSTPRFATTINVYHENAGYLGALHFVVEPEGVVRFLANDANITGIDPCAPEAVCGLDTVNKDLLLPYATTVYVSYDSLLRVTELKTSGCGSCGGAGAAYQYSYGLKANYSWLDSNESYRRNGWKWWQRTLESGGLRRVVFSNFYHEPIFEVIQDINGGSNHAVTHTIYGWVGADLGWATEKRNPSACTNYTCTTSGGWVSNVSVPGSLSTEGLVDVYKYVSVYDDPNDDPNMVRGRITWDAQLVRHGAVSDASHPNYYVSITQYGDGNAYSPVRAPVATFEFPTMVAYQNGLAADSASGIKTAHGYEFFDPNNTSWLKTHAVAYAKVSSAQNGQGDGQNDPVAQVLERNVETRDANGVLLYRSHWTRRADGSLSYTEEDSLGRTAKTIEDVDTDAPGAPSLPGDWSGYARPNGANLVATYTYDNVGRTATTTDPTGQKTVTCYMSMHGATRGVGTTTALTTLTAPHMDAGGVYNYLPVQIEVTDVSGKTLCSATGAPGSGVDGNMRNDWTKTSGIATAFDGNLVARTDTIYQWDADHILARKFTHRYHTIIQGADGSLNTNYYRSVEIYEPNTGRATRRIEVVQGTDVERVSKTVYDQLGRVTATYVGVSAAGHSMEPNYTADPALYKVSETFYDQSTPGSGTSGVRSSLVTSSKSYYNTDANYVQTLNYYDWRGRLRMTVPQAGPSTVRDLDHMDRAAAVAQYASAPDGPTVVADDDYAATVATNRRALSTASYDVRGQAYQQLQYSVDPTTGAASGPKTTNYWCDIAGRQVKTTPPGDNVASTKIVYDGAGRTVYSATCAPEGSNHWSLDPNFILGLTRNVYSSGGQVTEVRQGTSVTYTNGVISGDNAVAVSKTWYDADANGGGAWRPYVTGESALKASSTAEYVLTTYEYDSAGRVASTTSPDPDGGGDLKPTKLATTYDALGRTLTAKTYKFVSGGSDVLLAQTVNEYGPQGAMAAKVYKVVSGAATDYLVTSYAYDGYGRQCKVTQPSGSYTKTAYNLGGWALGTYLCVPGAGADDPNMITNADIVIEQAKYVYDSIGRQIQTTSYQRKETNTTTGGELDGSLARVTYSAAWYDSMGRGTHSANFGAAASFTRSTEPNVPNSSDDYIVSKTDYDGYGRPYKTTDNKGHVTKIVFDSAGRKAYTIENYQSWASEATDMPASRSSDINRITAYGYNAAGQVASLTALDTAADGNASVADDQKTTYAFNDGGDPNFCLVPRSDILLCVTYPDSNSSTDNVRYAYYANGARKTMTDQRGTVHTYTYNDVGRLTADGVTTTGTGVDDAVLRIATAYDDYGRPAAITSLNHPDATADGNVVNQVTFEHDPNAWGNVSRTWQGHYGIADANDPNVRSVAYDYDATLARLNRMTYPNGRVLWYSYGTSGGVNDVLGRIDNLAATQTTAADANVHAAYTYIGAGTIIKVSHPGVTGGLNLTYGAGGDTPAYGGMDRFGRVTDHKWINDAGTTTLDRFKYVYDRNSNRLYRKNDVDGNWSELYHANNATSGAEYDGLDRLREWRRGTLAGDGRSINSTGAKGAQLWDLDGVGNWRRFAESAADGVTWDSNQTRTNNAVNEITNIDANTGSIWPTPTYDPAGNMTSGPFGLNPANRMHLKYDAWNRLTAAYADSGGSPGTTIAQYAYDGRRFRTSKAVARYEDSNIPTYVTGWDRTDFYYNESWQVLEERKAVVGSPSTVSGPAALQYVWDIRYIDAAVLRDENTDPAQDNDCTDSGGSERLYYTQDLNFNVMALIAADGMVAERYVYDAYGKPTIYNADWSATAAWASSKKNEVLYCGYRWNPETGTYQVRNREYQPSLGGWISRDALKHVDDMNLYAYGHVLPTGRIDASGLKSMPVTSDYGKITVDYSEVIEEVIEGKNVASMFITVTFAPDANKVCCKQIGALQLIRIVDDKKNSVEDNLERIERSTPDGWRIDRDVFNKRPGNPWYGAGIKGVYPKNGNYTPGSVSPGEPATVPASAPASHPTTTPGSAAPGKVTNAKLEDTPASYIPATIEAQVFFVCRDGTDKPKNYGGTTWSFKVTSIRPAKAEPIAPSAMKGPTKELKDSIDKWNDTVDRHAGDVPARFPPLEPLDPQDAGLRP